MGKRKSFLKAGSLYFVGNIFDKAVAFITVPIFTRLLSTSDYGIANTYLSWVSIITVIITLSIGNSFRTACVDYKKEINKYASSVFFLGTISAVFITIIILIASHIIHIDLQDNLILLCCIQSYATSIIAAIQWKYLIELEYIKRTIIQCLPNLIIIIISVILINNMEADRYLGKIYAYVSVNTFIALGYLIYYAFNGRTFIKIEYWKYALAFSMPLIFHSLSNTILAQADRSMITTLRSPSETGIYSLAYQFGMVPAVITATVESVWIPWFTKKMQNGEEESINKFSIPYINIVVLSCICIMLVAPEVLIWMTPESYNEGVYIIAPVVFARFLMFLASISIDLEYYNKRTKSIALNTIIAAIINISLNFIFIPRYGGIAAAYTTVVAYGVSFIAHCYVAHRQNPRLFGFKIYILPFFEVLIFSIITNLIMNYTLARWIIAMVIGMVFLVTTYKYYKRIKET